MLAVMLLARHARAAPDHEKLLFAPKAVTKPAINRMREAARDCARFALPTMIGVPQQPTFVDPPGSVVLKAAYKRLHYRAIAETDKAKTKATPTFTDRAKIYRDGLGLRALRTNEAYVYARHDSAEDFSRLNALLFTAMAWIFIPAYSLIS